MAPLRSSVTPDTKYRLEDSVGPSAIISVYARGTCGLGQIPRSDLWALGSGLRALVLEEKSRCLLSRLENTSCSD